MPALDKCLQEPDMGNFHSAGKVLHSAIKKVRYESISAIIRKTSLEVSRERKRW